MAEEYLPLLILLALLASGYLLFYFIFGEGKTRHRKERVMTKEEKEAARKLRQAHVRAEIEDAIFKAFEDKAMRGRLSKEEIDYAIRMIGVKCKLYGLLPRYEKQKPDPVALKQRILEGRLKKAQKTEGTTTLVFKPSNRLQEVMAKARAKTA